MGYDPLEESLRLILRGAPAGPAALSRRRRFLPVAVDVDGDIAVTVFLRRGVSGQPQLESWILERLSQGWDLLGGGGGSFDQGALAGRPAAAQMGALAHIDSSGRVSRNAARFLRGPGFVSYAHIRVAAEISGLRVGDRRITVPQHGHTAIVWGTRRPPAAVLLGPGEQRLGLLPLQIDPPPRRRRRHRPVPGNTAMLRPDP